MQSKGAHWQTWKHVPGDKEHLSGRLRWQMRKEPVGNQWQTLLEVPPGRHEPPAKGEDGTQGKRDQARVVLRRGKP